MKEYPILMRGPLVRATLEDRKTMTRRIVKPQPEGWNPQVESDGETWAWCLLGDTDYSERFRCPYGGVGSILWCREAWCNNFGQLIYRADYDPGSFEYGAKGWKPSIHMPRSACRLTLEVVSVRVERLQDISEADIKAEGFERVRYRGYTSAKIDDSEDFSDAWDALYGKAHPWFSNPWIWAITYRRVQP